MKKEIGSEFWSDPSQIPEYEIWGKYSGEKRFYLSGRTALYAIIEDIKRTYTCQIAYLPCYCCDSMVEPFVQHGLSVEFYNVSAKQGFHAEIDPEYNCDIVLTLDYFGYRNIPVELPQAIHIHDITHSLLTEPSYQKPDYYFGSLRKWGPVAGAGLACKTHGQFLTDSPVEINSKYLAMRDNAYALKEQYINCGFGEKSIFLNLFAEAEAYLDIAFAGYAADEKSIAAAKQIWVSKELRRQNAAQLTKALENCKILDLVYSKLASDEVPLFVPVLVRNGLRNELRSYLIQNQVYCPIHWPVHNNCDNEIYQNELSLICDQRYSTEEIQREIDLILDFEERYCIN